MSVPRIPVARSTGLPIPATGGGSVTPGGGAKIQSGGPDGLSARPVLTRSQSMPPRARLPGVPAARASGTQVHASPDHVGQDATPAPTGARTYDYYMNQLSGLRVDPPAAKVPADGAGPPEKPAAQSPLSASTGGGAKSDDPFNWTSKLFPAGGDTLPPLASSTGAKPERRSYELPPNPFDTVGTPQPSSLALGAGPKPPEKPDASRVATPVTSTPAGKTPGGDAATTGKPTSEQPLPASTGGGAKSDDPFDWSSKLFPAGGDTLGHAASGTGAKPGGRPYELPPNPFDRAGDPRPSSPASGGESKLPEKPVAELPLNTFFTVDPSPVASGGGPEKLKVNTSVTIEPAGKMQGESPGDAGTPGKPATDPRPATSTAPDGAKSDKPGKVHIDTSVDIEPPATGAGGSAVPPHSPPVLSEMQMLQETQRQGMQQQADMQKMAIENQVLTARLKLEMDLTTAVTDFIKKQGEGIKHAAAG